ncbi:MAG: hypothetical protein LLG04_03535 [Parachlamydia sp.]|nr:hypothetical protein [Parachlamydia sp.]
MSTKASRSSKHHSKKKSGCCCATVISSDDINPNGFVIDEPGVYTLTEDVVFRSKTAGAVAIVIDADNVTLNLCEKTLSQRNSTSGTIGVLVNARENVVIENGSIRGFKLFGVRVNAETSYLTLQNLTVLENGVDNPALAIIGGGIVITSGLPSAITHDIVIKNVTSSGNILAGLILSGVRNVDVLDSRFNNNTSATTGYGTNAWGVLATAFTLVSLPLFFLVPT